MNKRGADKKETLLLVLLPKRIGIEFIIIHMESLTFKDPAHIQAHKGQEPSFFLYNKLFVPFQDSNGSNSNQGQLHISVWHQTFYWPKEINTHETKESLCYVE